MQSKSGSEDHRNLNRIKVSASTARVMNLHALNVESQDIDAHREKPLFRNKTLNSSIIIKHKLRPSEMKLFNNRKATATKVLLMIDDKEMNFGARSIFIGQPGYAEMLCEAIGVRSENEDSDFETLKALDALPSLDPFIVREHLKTIGRTPAECYFGMSPADTEQIFAFALAEVTPLAALMCSSESLVGVYAMKLARKIILGEGGREFEPLRQALRLDEAQFANGMFCWKAFIYYKWRLKLLSPQTDLVIQQMADARVRQGGRAISNQERDGARAAIAVGIAASLTSIRASLRLYDDAYKHMTETEKTKPFRDFLLHGPIYFSDLSERLAGIDHIVGYWCHRHAMKGPHAIPADELASIYDDFLDCLDPDTGPPLARALA